VRRLAIAIVCAVAVLVAARERAVAMPPFAQAYGVQCSTCHTQVPTLNAYGRYVQRTGYASLDPHVLRTTLPVWIGEQESYDSSSGYYKPQGGNLAIHAVGSIANDWTYHFQQWIWSNNASGDLDTFWLAYNNLFHRDGHVFVGKIEAPGPSPYSQWADLSPFATPEITVGEHAWQNDANRWGAKMNYIHGDADLEAGWMYNNAGWSGFSDFGQDTDKTFEWKAAYANGTQPLEFGVLGSRGAVNVSTGLDQYHSLGGYIQRDPTGLIPGVLALYQAGYDANPGINPNTGFVASGPANSTALTTELYQTFFHSVVYLGLRKEWTNDGLGDAAQGGDVDAAFTIAKYLRLYLEEGISQNSKPAWRYTLWWTVPLRRSAW
jgi:hypothetical protein